MVELDLFAAFITVIGSAIQASVFGSVAVLLAGFDADEQKYRKKLVEVAALMKRMKIAPQLRERVNTYFENLWDYHHTTTDNLDDFLHELSPSLEIDIKVSLYRKLISQVPFLQSSSISQLFIEAFATCIQTRMFLEGDFIMRKGEYGDWMGFIGPEGQVAILDPTTSQRKVVRVLREGDYIGEMALFFAIRRTADVQALTWLQLHILTRESYVAIKTRYPDDAIIVENAIEALRQGKQYKMSSVKRQ